MTNTKTADVTKTLNQINQLVLLGCQLVRVAILDDDDLKALKQIVHKSPAPIVADIHFNYEYAIKAIESGVAKIRINPGNINDPKHLDAIIAAARKNHVAIRIGINSGSLPIKSNDPADIVDYLINLIRQFEDRGFDQLILSIKSSNVLETQKLYTLLAKNTLYPIHLGLTEAGNEQDSAIKSALALGPLLQAGIGDTIRISVSGDPCKELVIVKKILSNLNLYDQIANVIACPTCGRTQIDLEKLLIKINEFLNHTNQKIKICLMGCNVNGIGESLKSDIGMVGANHKVIFYYKGKQDQIVDEKDAFDYFKKLYQKFSAC